MCYQNSADAYLINSILTAVCGVRIVMYLWFVLKERNVHWKFSEGGNWNLFVSIAGAENHQTNEPFAMGIKLMESNVVVSIIYCAFWNIKQMHSSSSSENSGGIPEGTHDPQKASNRSARIRRLKRLIWIRQTMESCGENYAYRN